MDYPVLATDVRNNIVAYSYYSLSIRLLFVVRGSTERFSMISAVIFTIYIIFVYARTLISALIPTDCSTKMMAYGS